MLNVVPILLQSLPLRWQSPWLLPAVLGVGAGVALVVLWLYPGQLRSVRGPWRLILPGLRMLAFMALAVSIARPVALRARATDDRSVVLVMLDRSRSMSIADGGRNPGELVALADALGLLPAGVRAAASADVTGDFERLRAAIDNAARAQADLEYARVSGRGVEQGEQRVRKALTDAAEIGRQLAGREASLPGGSGLKGKLAPLGQLPVDDLRGGGLIEARKRLDAAAVAIARYQEQGDQRLYETNAAVRQVCDALASRTRFELASELLVRPGGLLSRLEPSTQIRLYGYADGITSPVAVTAAPLSATRPSAEGADLGFFDLTANAGITWTSGRLAMKPEGNGSELTAAVASALAATEGLTVRGVVVYGDGQQVGEPQRVPALPPGVPVLAVGIAGASVPRDLSITDVAFPSAVFAGETVSVRVRIRAGGGATLDPSAVTLRVPGEDDGEDRVLSPVSIERLPNARNESNVWVQFNVRFERPGVHEMNIQAPPAAEGEATHDNNAVRRWVKVLPERIRVGLYSASAGWDFQHLRQTLTRREWFSLDSGTMDPANPALPLTAQQISRLDVLVLHDVPDRSLSASQWHAVEQMVSRRGGTVVFVAGPAFDVQSYAKNPQAAALLPFDFSSESRPEWKTSRSERGARLMPGAEFMRSDILRLDDADTSNRRWLDLQGLSRYLPVTKSKPGTKALIREEQSSLPVITELPRDAGRVIYVGTSDTWRWRSRGAEVEHERFWRQLIRHAAEEPYSVRVGRMAIDVDQVAAQAGQPITVRAKLYSADESLPATQPENAEPPPAESLVIQVVDARLSGERVVRTIKPAEAANGGGRLRATLTDLPPGEYIVRLTSPGNEAARSFPEVRVRVEGLAELEMRNLAGDPDRLRRIAESTGGRLLRPDQVSSIPGLLASAGDDRPRFTEWSLWDSPWLFGFVVACLGAEWALRKRVGLT